MMQRMLGRTEFAEEITTRGVYQIWHCNVASRANRFRRLKRALILFVSSARTHL